jgi:antitoxin HicB
MQREYAAFFEANEHGGYTVTVPALSGLVTEGKDPEHARSMAKDAIRCCIEGLKKAQEPIPLERESAQVKISIVALADPKTPPLQKAQGCGTRKFKDWRTRSKKITLIFGTVALLSLRLSAFVRFSFGVHRGCDNL